MSSHARLAPSAAERWMSCPGSIAMEQGLPDVTTEDAAKGSFLHLITADCLELGLEAIDFFGHRMVIEGHMLEVDGDDVDAMQPGIDIVRELPGELFIEYRVDLSRWMPGQFGTLDIGIISDDEIVIWDWKYGYIPVDPVGNKQLMIYALGFWHNIARHRTKATKFRLVIWQPFASGGGGEWEIDLDDLLAFGEEVRAAAEGTYAPDAPLNATLKGCQWCKARGHCAELTRKNLELLGIGFDDLTEAEEMGVSIEPPKLEKLSPELRGYVALHKKMIVAWLDMLDAEIMADVMAGRDAPYHKAVLGNKPKRVWSNEKKAEAVLARRLSLDELFTKKMKSPSMVEKLLGKKNWEKVSHLVFQGDPKPTLVPLTDRREAVEPISAMFDDVTNETYEED